MSALLVDDLRVSFGSGASRFEVVRGITFSLPQRHTLGIVGESGSGKSMTSLAVMGLLPSGASRGARQLSLMDKDLRELSDREMARLRGLNVSMIFQEPMTALNPVFKIRNQLVESFLLHGKGGRRQALERATYLLERVGVTPAARRLGQFPHELSGGLRQRAMIAMALMCSPQFLIADEPTTALDVTIQAQVLRLLRELQSEFDLGMLLITHDLGVVARAADSVAVMYAGQFVETGSVAEVFGNPRHPYTQGLIASVPKHGGGYGRRLSSIKGTVPSMADLPRGCAFVDRCPLAMAECGAGPVEMRETSTGHAVRCVRVAPSPPRSPAPLLQ